MGSCLSSSAFTSTSPEIRVDDVDANASVHPSQPVNTYAPSMSDDKTLNNDGEANPSKVSTPETSRKELPPNDPPVTEEEEEEEEDDAPAYIARGRPAHNISTGAVRHGGQGSRTVQRSIGDAPEFATHGRPAHNISSGPVKHGGQGSRTV